jgi:type I restriction enzyme S subunit
MNSAWKLYRFSDVARVASGLVDPKQPPFCDYIHVGPENIEAESGNLKDLRTATELKLISGKYLFDENAIVYSKIRPNLNKVCHPGFRGVCSADAYAIWVKEDLADRDFLLQVMRSPYFVEQAVGVSMRTGMPKINQSDLGRLTLPLPAMCEQKVIASVLMTWDQGIRQLTDLIAAKVRLKQGLMQQLLTGKRRFRAFVKSDTVQSSAAGDFPADWTLCRLGEVTEEVRRKNAAGVTRVLTASGTHGLVDQRDYFNRSVAGKSLAGYFHLKQGEFAYNRSLMKGYPYGATKRLDLYEEGVVSSLYLCFRIISGKCDSNWLIHVFESDVFNSQLRGIAKMGARAHGLLNVAASEFLHMVLPMPSLPEQKAIAKTLDMMDKERVLLQQQLDALKKQKKGLMQKLLTGQIRVKLPSGVT